MVVQTCEEAAEGVRASALNFYFAGFRLAEVAVEHTVEDGRRRGEVLKVYFDSEKPL